jgi:hypothetical protein
MRKNAEKIKNPKISSCEKTHLYIKLTLSRSEIHIFFIFRNQNFFQIFHGNKTIPYPSLIHRP